VNGSPRNTDENGVHHTSSLENSFVSGDDDEEPVVFEAASTQATVLRPQAIKARVGVVNIPARVPPPLPPRNNARLRTQMVDQGTSFSPVKPEFEEVDLRGAEKRSSEEEEILSPDWRSEVKADEKEEEKEEIIETEHIDKEEEEEQEEEKHEKVLLNGSTDYPDSLHSHEITSPEKEEGDKFHSVPGSPNEFE